MWLFHGILLPNRSCVAVLSTARNQGLHVQLAALAERSSLTAADLRGPHGSGLQNCSSGASLGAPARTLCRRLRQEHLGEGI